MEDSDYQTTPQESQSGVDQEKLQACKQSLLFIQSGRAVYVTPIHRPL